MKEINNYKKIRVKPYLYGFTFKSLLLALLFFFLITMIVFFDMELNFTRIGIWIFLQVINLVVNKYIFGDSNILEKLGASSLPNEITDLTK